MMQHEWHTIRKSHQPPHLPHLVSAMVIVMRRAVGRGAHGCAGQLRGAQGHAQRKGGEQTGPHCPTQQFKQGKR